ncbi:MAG: NUDIX domain-containing protein [Anaerolineae bacterium]
MSESISGNPIGPDGYPRPSVTADVVVWSAIQGTPHILLIRRRHWPYENCWALPGGFLDITETLEEAARRELAEETGLTVSILEPLLPFDAPERDPRKRVITMAYLALVPNAKAVAPVEAGDDAIDAQWWPFLEMPELAFDHDQIIVAAQRHLRRRLLGDDLGRHLMPAPFDEPMLADVIQQWLGESPDTERVLKLLLAAGVIEPVDERHYRYRELEAQAWPYF